MTQTLVHVHHLNLFHTSRLGVIIDYAPRKPKYSKINIWSSNKGHRANALAPGGDEGRDKHRYASGRRK